jgi:hypothetical protein
LSLRGAPGLWREIGDTAPAAACRNPYRKGVAESSQCVNRPEIDCLRASKTLASNINRRRQGIEKIE